MKFLIALSTLLAGLNASAANQINPDLPSRIRAACVVQISSLDPAAFRRFKVSPASFCDCVAARHTEWAREDIVGAREADQYLRAILALYTPTDTAGQRRVQSKYFAEFDNDMNLATICNRK